MSADRGFKKLKGKTITAVDASCINYVLLLCDDGTVFEVNAEINYVLWNNGIPELSLKRQKEKLQALPQKKKQEKVAWPYSPVGDSIGVPDPVTGQEAIDIAVRAGITTPAGNLKKRYR